MGGSRSGLQSFKGILQFVYPVLISNFTEPSGLLNRCTTWQTDRRWGESSARINSPGAGIQFSLVSMIHTPLKFLKIVQGFSEFES